MGRFLLGVSGCMGLLRVRGRCVSCWVVRVRGRGWGGGEDPLLVSVRSGARESMPGMMDSVLNLGLNDESTAGLAARTGDERFAWDCYRRLVQMFGNVVRGVSGERFEDEI